MTLLTALRRYFLFEVPSNLLLEKIGVRKSMMRIMIGWGAISACMMLVSSPLAFYVMRFLLGAFDAGFLPGIILYLTYWYPGSRRARIIAIFMSAVAVAGVIGGPLSGWVMSSMAGVYGLKRWQWMFCIEGLPTLLLGLAVPAILVDRPSDAKWLTTREKKIIEQSVSAEQLPASDRHGYTFGKALKDPVVYVLRFIYFTIICGIYAIGFWLPIIIKGTGVANVFSIGLYSMIPYGLGAVGMISIGRHSDIRMERRWHLAFCCLLGALGLVLLAATARNLSLSLAALSLATITLLAAMPVFWAIPSLPVRFSRRGRHCANQ
ncbi:MFS transporter [Paraburkholderia metrosideri]|uniref:MFS transporter n=1 Tax=Paraburkholderia metrosideri TaxID=580937 RepID=UPI0038B7C5B3